MTAAAVHSSLLLANRSAAALWVALAEARGYELVRRHSFIAADGSERNGLRVVIVSPDPVLEDLDELTELIARRPGWRLLVEDPFGVVSFDLEQTRMPVMIRTSGSSPAGGQEVVRVERPDQVALVEDILVRGFPLTNFQPYRRGEAFPPALLKVPGVELYLISHEGDWAGAGMTVADDSVSGVYFVTTLPEFRSRGLARTLMHAVLHDLEPLPVTLTAAAPAKSLYDSLGFTTVGHSIWWSR